MKSKYAKIKFQPSTKRICPNDHDGPFVESPNWLMRRKELSPGAKLAYCVFNQSANKELFVCIKQETVALEIGVSVSQVKNYIKELAHFGLIEVKQTGLTLPNKYRVLQHPWMDEEVQTNWTDEEDQDE